MRIEIKKVWGNGSVEVVIEDGNRLRGELLVAGDVLTLKPVDADGWPDDGFRIEVEKR